MDVLHSIIYDKKKFVARLIKIGGKPAVKKFYHILKRDKRLLLDDILYHYMIREFGVCVLRDHEPIDIPARMIPDMDPTDFAKWISDLRKGLIGQ